MPDKRKKGPFSGLLETLLRPDHDDEEMKERGVVIDAANQLQVGEFQLLQLAYRDWHGEDLPEALISKIFTDYMTRSQVPHWARHYARNIIRGCDNGSIDENDQAFHHYDHEYGSVPSRSMLRFCIAVVCLVSFLGGGIIVANMTVENPASMFPPYLDINDLPKKKLPIDGLIVPKPKPEWPGSEEYFV